MLSDNVISFDAISLKSNRIFPSDRNHPSMWIFSPFYFMEGKENSDGSRSS